MADGAAVDHDGAVAHHHAGGLREVVLTADVDVVDTTTAAIDVAAVEDPGVGQVFHVDLRCGEGVADDGEGLGPRRSEFAGGAFAVLNGDVGVFQHVAVLAAAEHRSGDVGVAADGDVGLVHKGHLDEL